MASTSEFMQTLIGLYSAINQKKYQEATVEQQKHEQERLALHEVLGLMGQTDNPESLLPFLTKAAPSTAIDVAGLMNVAHNYTPSAETQRASASKRGRAAMSADEQQTTDREAATSVLTGQSPWTAQMGRFLGAQLAQNGGAPGLGMAALSQQLTGALPGNVALSGAVAGLGAPQLQHAAQVQTGLAPDANAQLGADTSRYSAGLGYASAMAGNRVEWARLAQQGQLGMLGLQIDQAKIAQAAQGHSIFNVSQLSDFENTLAALGTQVQKAGDVATRQRITAQMHDVVDVINTIRVQNGMQPAQYPRLDPSNPDAGTGRGLFHLEHQLPMTNYQAQPMNGQPSGTTLPPSLYPQNPLNQYR